MRPSCSDHPQPEHAGQSMIRRETVLPANFGKRVYAFLRGADRSQDSHLATKGFRKYPRQPHSSTKAAVLTYAKLRLDCPHFADDNQQA
jgi:hypothetical protein